MSIRVVRQKYNFTYCLWMNTCLLLHTTAREKKTLPALSLLLSYFAPRLRSDDLCCYLSAGQSIKCNSVNSYLGRQQHLKFLLPAPAGTMLERRKCYAYITYLVDEMAKWVEPLSPNLGGRVIRTSRVRTMAEPNQWLKKLCLSLTSQACGIIRIGQGLVGSVSRYCDWAGYHVIVLCSSPTVGQH